MGYATEAAKPVVEHAFTTVQARRIVADIDPGNSASIRVAEKIGLKYAGDGDYDGSPCKSFVMTAEDFAASS